MKYEPHPIDTSAVILSPAIRELTEFLSRNTHEVWARERMSEGWRWGPERNDQRKEHPSLIPYEQLSHEEQELDRQTAMETLKVILARGFRIEGPEDA